MKPRFPSIALLLVAVVAGVLFAACSQADTSQRSNETPERTAAAATPTTPTVDAAMLEDRVADFRRSLWSDELSPEDNRAVFHVSRSDPSSPEVQFHLVALGGTGDFFGQDCDQPPDATPVPPGTLRVCTTTKFTNNAAHTMFDTSAACSLERNPGSHDTNLGNIAPGEMVSWDWSVLITSRWVGKANCLMKWKLAEPTGDIKPAP